MGNQETVEFIRLRLIEDQKPSDIVEQLLDFCLRVRNSGDNLAAILIQLAAVSEAEARIPMYVLDGRGGSSTSHVCIVYSDDDAFQPLWQEAHNILCACLGARKKFSCADVQDNDKLCYLRSHPCTFTLQCAEASVPFLGRAGCGFASNKKCRMRAAKIALALVVAVEAKYEVACLRAVERVPAFLNLLTRFRDLQ